MADIVLITPRFEASYWGLEHALQLFGKRANMPIAALPLLAALTPAEHKITLIDENVEDIDFDLCAKADIIGVTGMIVQRLDPFHRAGSRSPYLSRNAFRDPQDAAL